MKPMAISSFNSTYNYNCSLFFLLFFLGRAMSIGINYGQIANNLPTPDAVVPLLRSIGVSKVKLYDADQKVLKSFANTGVEFVVGLPNECVARVARDPAKALTWTRNFVQPHLPQTKITLITVGNEVLTGNDTSSLLDCLLPAMENVHAALAQLGLDSQVGVTSAHSLAVLETSYPPSAGVFKKDLAVRLGQILSFHTKTGSPFLINAYPFFAYKASPKQVSLDYVLFQTNDGVLDPATGAKYYNMLHAQVDAVHSAIDALHVVSGKGNVEIRVSETGWPSKGDSDEAGATPENAMKYNGNLIKMVSEKKGTPMRSGSPLEVYVFALFNENMKPGPTSERNYGLFKPDGTPAYQLGLGRGGGGIAPVNGNGTTTGGGGGGGGGGDGSSPESSSTGYFTISTAETGVHIDWMSFGMLRGVVLASMSLFWLLL
ncbi:Glucan endo-1,3-beta-glucosidase 11 [Acorus gramineus]|uniref:glucan endo-1,3-beta-D-glucosidase n=1 Tax=Acorus gramineus TaxID=55184 RepID=A0AAV9B6U3_ACOGR|nr:Glucan endo-1,3-beta-glucosidase 11 [Acorus gramineus]